MKKRIFCTAFHECKKCLWLLVYSFRPINIGWFNRRQFGNGYRFKRSFQNLIGINALIDYFSADALAPVYKFSKMFSPERPNPTFTRSSDSDFRAVLETCSRQHSFAGILFLRFG